VCVYIDDNPQSDVKALKDHVGKIYGPENTIISITKELPKKLGKILKNIL
jgi:hypothetical protein